MRIYLAKFSVWMDRVGSCNSRDEERRERKGEEREKGGGERRFHIQYLHVPTLCVKNEREVVRRIKMKS